MLEFINEYRSSKDRRSAIIGFKTFMRITKGDSDKCGLKTAFTELKTLKDGAFQCEKVFRIKLCDLLAIAGAMDLCIIIKRKKTSCDCCEEEK